MPKRTKANETTISVLLMEDNDDHSALIESQLRNGTAVELERVNQLSAGLERIGKGGIDAVLLDLGLLDSDGMETLEKTVRQFPNVPVVVLTTLDDETLALTAVKKGAQDYLAKENISSDLLLRSIRYAIERMANSGKSPPKEELRQRTLYFTDSEWEQIRNLAFGENRKYSDVVRTIVRDYFGLPAR